MRLGVLFTCLKLDVHTGPRFVSARRRYNAIYWAPFAHCVAQASTGRAYGQSPSQPDDAICTVMLPVFCGNAYESVC